MSEATSTVEHMNDPLAGLITAVAAVERAWAGASAGGERMPRPGVDELAERDLLRVNEGLGAALRHLDAVRATVAAEIARRSRAELGPEGLAKKHGFRTATALIAATTGSTVGDAVRAVAVGEATAPRSTVGGETKPARHPHVASAVRGGLIGTAAAAAIIAMLDRVALRLPREDRHRVDEAEEKLAAQAPGLTVDQLSKVIAQAEAHLNPAALESDERARRDQRSLTLYQRDGMIHLNGRWDAETGAPIVTAIQAMVTAQFRAEGRDAGPGPGAGGTGATGGVGEDAPARVGAADDVDAPRRTVAQRQADALSLLAQHALGCTSELPLEGATVIVRVSHEELVSGVGVATIDGVDQPVSVATARRLAAGGGVIPCVLDGKSEILDFGRTRRLFTPAQRLALAERDGGCAMCGLPPGMTKAHHIRWWARDAGPTDLANGVLLCESCHHRIHDNHWDIRVEGTGVGGRVWFIPPSSVDPARTPRLGGRARYAYAA